MITMEVWETINFDSPLGARALQLLTERDHDIVTRADPIITDLFQTYESNSAFINRWSDRKKDFIISQIGGDRTNDYRTRMLDLIGDYGFPSIAGIVGEWQDYLMRYDEPMSNVEGVSPETDHGLRTLIGYGMAETLCGDMKDDVLLGFYDLHDEYRAALNAVYQMTRELREYLYGRWDNVIAGDFYDRLHRDFQESDITIYDTILAVQYPLCKEHIGNFVPVP